MRSQNFVRYWRPRDWSEPKPVEIVPPLLDHTEAELLLKLVVNTPTCLTLNPHYYVHVDKALVELEKKKFIEFFLDTPHQPLCGPKVRMTELGRKTLEEFTKCRA